MNRGEWGEPYAALRLLGDKKLYLSDENGDANPEEWMEVLKVVRQETADRLVTYSCNLNNVDIDIEVNNQLISRIPAERFLIIAELLKADISGASGRSFNVSDEVQEFISEAEMHHLKAKSIEKSDIFISTRDPRNSIVRENIGFSIKCEFGENPTLFNTAKASAAKYRITGMTNQLMNQINSMVDAKGHASVTGRCAALRENGCGLSFVGYEYAARAKCCAFQENLDQINPRLPEVIERMMWNHFMEGQTEIDIFSVTNRIINENPCNISLGDSKYPYMIKMFLYSAYCGMTASTLWDGRSTVKGGYITVKETGEVVANYALESESFKSFLFSHCYLDFPSTDQGHGDYGRVYVENGDYYFKLNFQIRIR